MADRLAPRLAVPAALTAPCRPVSDLPSRALSSADVGRLWGEDRAALGDCGRRHKALADVVTIMEKTP